jgi:hypothetical protein
MTLDEGGLLEKIGANKVNRVADLEEDAEREGIGHPGSPRGEFVSRLAFVENLRFFFLRFHDVFI